jgi:hypothetical protein
MLVLLVVRAPRPATRSDEVIALALAALLHFTAPESAADSCGPPTTRWLHGTLLVEIDRRRVDGPPQYRVWHPWDRRWTTPGARCSVSVSPGAWYRARTLAPGRAPACRESTEVL